MTQYSVYMAGPDVFLDDAEAVLKMKSSFLSQEGYIALFPFEGNKSSSEEIVRNNEAQIKKCDFVVANLCPFRGCEPDSGTVYEIGFAKALGKQIYAYGIPKIEYFQQVTMHQYLRHGDLHCLQGWQIENFGHRLNIMLSENVKIFKTFEECIKNLKIENI